MFNCNQNSQVQKNIKYGFKDLISKQIISQFQFLWGLKISVKTAIKFYILLNLFT
jgi:hypothetical protein